MDQVLPEVETIESAEANAPAASAKEVRVEIRVQTSGGSTIAAGVDGDHQSDEIHMLPLELKDHSFVEVEPSDSLNESIEAIPDRMAFKIGTAADLVGVKPYVLRFWETEFDALHPKKVARASALTLAAISKRR